MTNPKILVCMDFDHTLLDCNTSVEVKTLLGNKEIPKEISALSQDKHGHIAYMREVFRYLHKNKVTRDEYTHWLSGLPLVEGMRELLLQLYESGDCENVIMSDSNSFFIQTVLRRYQVNGTVAKVFTNQAEFDQDGCLQIAPFQNQNSCNRCPHNMCKGCIVVNYMAKRMVEGVQFGRTLYIGDGGNDVCPSLRLGVNDYVFARTGYRLLRSLEKMPARDVKCTIVPWETAYDIKSVLLTS
ncbi:hypothetical protein JTE90_009277 [Oedothorax gibbosus]|uniref:Pyridoxal phosphate phosphatase n=1 Tax=Oedothorax gibbosus TaxID=931172 RepID=A0AAV6V1G3_9ARAC|nr:hypothetical protein JTE90_009277 [Oedothorax gibbosus]